MLDIVKAPITVSMSVEHIDLLIETAMTWSWWAGFSRNDKGWLVYVDQREEGGEIVEKLVTPQAIQRALQEIVNNPDDYAGNLMASILSGDADIGETDTFLQLCVFGELIYG